MTEPTQNQLDQNLQGMFNTLKAGWWPLVKAVLFGKKIIVIDDNYKTIFYLYKGTRYLTSHDKIKINILFTKLRFNYNLMKLYGNGRIKSAFKSCLMAMHYKVKVLP